MLQIKNCKSYWRQFVAVITATLASVSNGMEYAWSSPAVPRLMANESSIPVTHDQSYWLETLYILGGVCALPITFSVLQFLGRRKSILIAGTISFICWILVASASSIEQIYAGRFLSGIGANIAFVSIPMYSAEITEPNVRGFIGSFVYIMNILGVVLSYSIVPFIPIYASAIVAACISFLQVITFFWQPESPYYLLTKHQQKEAKQMLVRLRSADRNVEEEMELTVKAVDRQNSEKGRPFDLVLIPSNRKAFIIMAILNTAQNMCGITVITMNVQLILDKSGTIISSELSAILFGIVILVASLVGSVMIDKFGRKALLISSFLLTSLFLGILGIYFHIQDTYGVSSSYHWVPFLAVLAYAFVFKYGAGLVPIVITAELFPTSVKSLGMAFSDLWFPLWATISIKIYFTTVELYGFLFPFFLFSASGFLAAVFVSFYVPETKGNTLEEIQMILKGRLLTRSDIGNVVEDEIK